MIRAFGGEDLQVAARFERRSILATTLVVVGTSVALVALTMATALWWMVRKGRRQLAEDARGS